MATTLAGHHRYKTMNDIHTNGIS